jgi:hypothetical protein
MDFPRTPFFLILLGLGLSVFGWGLQYKLSLYDPPQASSHQMPQAKLLSQDEQATAAHTSLTAKIPVKFCWAVLSCAFSHWPSIVRVHWHPVNELEKQVDRGACISAPI